MKDLIKQLAGLCAPIGQEERVREQIRELVTPYADDVREDVIGNLIVTKKGNGTDKQHLMIVAHMDEPGLMVVHVESNGFLRVAKVGDMDATFAIGKRVQFPNGTIGVVGSSKVTDASHMDLYIDLGVESEEAALTRVQVGDTATLAGDVTELSENRLFGKAFDNRVGCAVAVEALKRLNGQTHDVSFVFTAQQGVGNRGVKTAAYGLEPDFGLVLDGVHAGDAPGGSSLEIKLGEGVSIKILDNTVIIPPRIKNYLIDQAEAGHIKYQLEVNAKGSSDAGALLISRDGVPVGGLSVPVRYTVNGAEVVDLRDVEAMVELVVRALQNYAL